MPHPANQARVVVSLCWFLGCMSQQSPYWSLAWMNIQRKGLRVPDVTMSLLPVFSMSRKNFVPYLGWPCNLICQVSTSSLHSHELLQSDGLARPQSTEQQVEEPGGRQGRASKTPLMPLNVRYLASHFINMTTLNLQKDLKQVCFFLLHFAHEEIEM